MNHATINNFDEVWKVFQDNKEWFPHVWNTKVKKRLLNNELIFQDGVVITYSKSRKNGKIGRDTDVFITKGDYIIHQIINSNPSNGNAKKVIKEYFDHVNQNVYLTVRSENIAANKFYEKVGMTKVGYINWSKGKMKGNVWKYVNEE